MFCSAFRIENCTLATLPSGAVLAPLASAAECCAAAGAAAAEAEAHYLRAVTLHALGRVLAPTPRSHDDARLSRSTQGFDRREKKNRAFHRRFVERLKIGRVKAAALIVVASTDGGGALALGRVAVGEIGCNKNNKRKTQKQKNLV